MKHKILTTAVCLYLLTTVQISFANTENFFKKHSKHSKCESAKQPDIEKEKDITISYNNGIYIIKISPEDLNGELKPYYVVNLKTNKDVYEETNARLVINAGFFDPKNHQTVSYLTLSGKQILDPHNNKNLMENEHLQPYMDKILNRTEFRILRSKTTGEYKYDITPHSTPVEEDYEIWHSIQGGPGLVPKLRLAEEFFVLTDKEGKIINESASSLSKYPRTLLGIKNNEIYFVIATTESPLTLPEAASFLSNYGFEKAMAFDGGGSVSVDYRDENIHIISDRDQTARKLKSFFIITNDTENDSNHTDTEDNKSIKNSDN